MRHYPTVKGDRRLLPTPPAPPKKRGKSPEQYAAELREYHKAHRAFIAHNAAIHRERAMTLGIKEYKWIAAVPELCAIARKNNGKIFRYASPPPEGHPGEGQCEADWCRCFRKAVVPGFS